MNDKIIENKIICFIQEDDYQKIKKLMNKQNDYFNIVEINKCIQEEHKN